MLDGAGDGYGKGKGGDGGLIEIGTDEQSHEGGEAVRF